MDHLLGTFSLYQLSGPEVALVWVMGVEPTRPKPQKPKSCTSTNFAIPRYGPSGETRTPGFMLPKHAPYQLGYTR